MTVAKTFRALFVFTSLVLVAACGSSGGGGSVAAPAVVVAPVAVGVAGIGTSAVFTGQISISNPQAFAKMLTYANVCSLNWFAGFDWGDYNCANWVNRGGYMTLQTYGGNQVVLGFAAGNQYSGAVGFQQQATVSLYNNSRGMQIVGTNAYGGGAGVRLVVDQGQLTSASFTGRLYFQDQTSPFGTVSLLRTY